MKNWTSRRIVVRLPGAMLSVRMTLSAVQANNMTVGMALAGDANPGEWGGCGDTANSGSCQSICASSIFAMPLLSTTHRLAEFAAPVFLDGRTMRSMAV
jgi:hypothetical protein